MSKPLPLLLTPLLGLLLSGCSSDGNSPGDATDSGYDATTSDASAADGSVDDVQTDADPAGPYDGFVSQTYAEIDAWICHPENDEDECSAGFELAAVATDGTTTIISHPPADDPAIDCFYVYPTAAADSGANSDLVPGVEELFVTGTQAGPLNAVCRVFAPVYPQVTLTSLLGISAEEPDFDLAYAGVLDAWKHYVANESGGRGVILVGHSQGTYHLRRLLAEEVEPDPRLHDRLVAAYLAGGTIEVPPGEDVGGTFASTPVCRTPDQTGCVLSWASFRADAPPPPESFFGRASAGSVAVCNHPAALVGGSAVLRGRFPTSMPGLFAAAVGGTVSPYSNPSDHPPIETGFFSLPGIFSGECVLDGGIHYLSVDAALDPDDPLLDEVPGELAPGWGLHLLDMYLVMDDLVALAESQAAAYLAGGNAEVAE